MENLTLNDHSQALFALGVVAVMFLLFLREGGKTSTVHKVASSGYKDDSYRASFAGIAPIQSNTDSVTILVSIDDPSLNAYSGGSVAAPVFSKIAEDTINYLGY